MLAADQPDESRPIAPRRRSRLIVVCLVIFGTMVVLGRMMPAILAILS